MKIYSKNKTYITFPPIPDGVMGCLVNGVPYDRESIEATNREAQGYERTMARLEASKAEGRKQKLINESLAKVAEIDARGRTD